MAGGAAIASSGCLGYTVESEDDVNDRKERTDSLEDERDSLDEELESLQDERDSLEGDVESLEESNTDLEEELSGVESNLEDSNGEQILHLYSWGLTHQNNATDAYNEAYSYYQDGDHTAARAEFNLCGGYYHSAENNFRGAKNVADALGETTVETYCSQAESRCGSMNDAAADYQSSMYYFNNGYTSTAEDYLDSGDAQYTEAQSYTLRDLGELETQLGVSI